MAKVKVSKPPEEKFAVEWWPIERCKPYKQNARKISERAVDKVAASLKEFGWRQPIVCEPDGTILAGHTRLLAARKLGMAQVPVHVAVGLTPAQRRAYRLMDNRSHEEATWDLDILGLELGELKGLDLDLSLTGFDTRKLDKLLLVRNPAEDDAPPVPEAPVSRLGDVWLMGEHRLVCGDCTDAETVKTAMGQLEPFLMVTDPPYGVEYDPEWRNRALNLAFRATATAYMKEDLEAAWLKAHQLFTGDVAYVWHADLPAIEVAIALLQCGFQVRNQIVWCKESYAISRGHYNPQHECCFYAVRKGKPAHWHGDNSQSTFWKVNRMDGQPRTGHAAQKPVEIMRRPILNHTVEGECVYEPFLGSGTTLIAAETTSRVCVALELDPAFVDVAIIRWQNLTGKQATLEGHGATFEHVREGRRLEAEDNLKEEVLNATR